MRSRNSPRRVAALAALIASLRFAGGAEAVERVLGRQGTCRMACCVGKGSACPRRSGSPHHLTHHAAARAGTSGKPSSDLSAKMDCGERCALLLERKHDLASPAGTHTSVTVGNLSPSSLVGETTILRVSVPRSVSLRAPPTTSPSPQSPIR